MEWPDSGGGSLRGSVSPAPPRQTNPRSAAGSPGASCGPCPPAAAPVPRTIRGRCSTMDSVRAELFTIRCGVIPVEKPRASSQLRPRVAHAEVRAQQCSRLFHARFHGDCAAQPSHRRRFRDLERSRLTVSVAFEWSPISLGMRSSAAATCLTRRGIFSFGSRTRALSRRIVLQIVSTNSFAVPIATSGSEPRADCIRVT